MNKDESLVVASHPMALCRKQLDVDYLYYSSEAEFWAYSSKDILLNMISILERLWLKILND